MCAACMLLPAVNDDEPTLSEDDIRDLKEGLAMSLEERIHWAESLWALFRELNPDRPVGYFKSFDSFEEYEAWKLAQPKPWFF